MIDVETLSDADLRMKLLEFGFPVMPITNTTRKVMVKKLKMLLENKEKTSSSDRRSLGKFSSDEESDTDKIIKKDKNRRVTMAVPPMVQPNNDISSPTILTEMRPPAAPTVSKEKSKRKSTKITLHVHHSDTNSDSEPEVTETKIKETPAKPATPAKKKSSPISKSEPESSSHAVKSPSESSSSRLTSSNRYSVYSSPTYDVSEDLNRIRSRLSLSNRFDYKPLSVPSVDDTNEETPFLSNFTRNLSQVSQKQDTPSSSASRPGTLKDYDINNGSSSLYKRSIPSTFAKPKARGDYVTRTVYEADKEDKTGKSNISLILVGAVTLFFIVLAALYYGLHSGSNSSDVIGMTVPYCDAMQKTNCMTAEEADGAIEIYQIIKPVLISYAIDSQCGDGDKFYMTDNDIINHMMKNYQNIRETEIFKDLDSLVYLLIINPYHGIRILQSSGDDFAVAPTESHEEYIKKAQQNSKRAFAVLTPDLPWKCSLRIRFNRLIEAVVIIFSISTLLWLAQYAYKWYKYYKQRSQEEIILMVERILDIIQLNATGDKFVVVNHIRDMLIPVNNRKKMESVWKKAVAFINENESRVRTEIRNVKGEPYEVWCWLGSPKVSSNSNKSWQGQAFETQAGSPNSPPTSPSSCLKIRGMVDDGDRNLHTIREAVLTKCTNACRILHCDVKFGSKCVYLKCASPADASIAYQNLHGWWYASQLVTVKYLRDERYLYHFPNSPKSGPPYLKPHGLTQ